MRRAGEKLMADPFIRYESELRPGVPLFFSVKFGSFRRDVVQPEQRPAKKLFLRHVSRLRIYAYTYNVIMVFIEIFFFLVYFLLCVVSDIRLLEMHVYINIHDVNFTVNIRVLGNIIANNPLTRETFKYQARDTVVT